MPLTDYSIVETNPPSPLPAAIPQTEKASERRGVGKTGENGESKASAATDEERTSARRIVDDLGAEFAKLREKGRSGAWADLESKVASSGGFLISTGMISLKDWVGTMIDIEQFRKSEGGTMESPGDALAKWLSEGEEAPKAKRKSGVTA